MANFIPTKTPPRPDSPAILCCGEALIDLFPEGEASASLQHAMPGGAPMNTAVALARLGIQTGFMGMISDDGYGKRLRHHLDSNKVMMDSVIETDQPTTLASVTLSEKGTPQYHFYLEGTSAPGLAPDHIHEDTLTDIQCLFTGGLALLLTPMKYAVSQLLRRSKGRRLVYLDPNVRAMVMEDRDAYVQVLGNSVPLADIVKFSEEDLAWLFPKENPADAARKVLDDGPRMVLLTRGAGGAMALTRTQDVEVPGERIQVTDTVGAGDAFNAGFLAWLAEHDRLSPAASAALTTSELTDALSFANRAAALTCTRKGASSPARAELNPPAPQNAPAVPSA